MAHHIAVVCGAGVSSTFLARALRRELADAGIDATVEALAEDQLPPTGADVVVVGAHLASRFDELRARVESSGARAFLLTAPEPVAAAREAFALLGLDHSSAAPKGHSHG